jgi:hypothetical protein
MSKKREPAAITPRLLHQVLDGKRSESVKGGFLGGLMKKAGKAVSGPVRSS